VAAVLGGIGSIPGAVVGSLVLGWTESFFTGYISSDYEDVFAFLFLVLILIFRPPGILGRERNPERCRNVSNILPARRPAPGHNPGISGLARQLDRRAMFTIRRNKKSPVSRPLVHVPDLSHHGDPGQHHRQTIEWRWKTCSMGSAAFSSPLSGATDHRKEMGEKGEEARWRRAIPLGSAS
jgi:hypothetical protein